MKRSMSKEHFMSFLKGSGDIPKEHVLPIANQVISQQVFDRMDRRLVGNDQTVFNEIRGMVTAITAVHDAGIVLIK